MVKLAKKIAALTTALALMPSMASAEPPPVPCVGTWNAHEGGGAWDINQLGARDYGNAVRAYWSGRVIAVRRLDYSYGFHVIIAHWNNRETLYAHLSRITTFVGERVSEGEIIGEVGSTGNSSGPHLHFEIR